jgi:hypothetical protein
MNDSVTNVAIDCRCCDGGLETLAHGVTVKWHLPATKLKCTDVDTMLATCSTCGLVQFTRGFSSIELEWIYGSYRTNTYLRMRRRYEPWYTRKLNRSIGNDFGLLDARRNHLEKLLSSAVQRGLIDSPKRVLDLGGDRGQFIPRLHSIQDRAVLEVSSQIPEAEVKKFSEVGEAREWRADLVMCCHVLEHLTDPISGLRSVLDQENLDQVLYLEVPLDRPPKRVILGRSTFGQFLLHLLWKKRATSVLLDFLSLVIRRVANDSISLFYKQSEHINFFDTQSLRYVIEQLGFKPIVFSNYDCGVGQLQMTALGVLATRKQVGPDAFSDSSWIAQT